MNGRWYDYFHESDFAGFWSERLSDSNVRALMILGIGFDPRCLLALRELASLGVGDRLGFIALNLSRGVSHGRRDALADTLVSRNREDLRVIAGCENKGELAIPMFDIEGHSVAGRRTLTEVATVTAVMSAYTDVIVDISGLPRAVFFPLIAYLLRLAQLGMFKNLHVTLVEEPKLEDHIIGKEYGNAEFLHTFGPREDQKLVWLPAIGLQEETRLERIYNRLRQSCIEICPVLPFPASPLRRSDDILVRLSEWLFEGHLVSGDNLILCDESSPFDTYRKILEVEEYYRERLSEIEEIGAVSTVVSPLASKTLSLGMLLAAVERSLPVCHVEPGVYELVPDDSGNLPRDVSRKPMEIWLAGEPYDEMTLPTADHPK